MAKKYEVTYKFSRVGYYDVKIEADSPEDAKRIAEEVADDPDKFIDYILDMDSNCLWEPVEVEGVEVWDEGTSPTDF